MKKIHKIINIFILINLLGCANYINKIHSDLDKQENAQTERRQTKNRDVFDQFRVSNNDPTNNDRRNKFNRPSTRNRSNFKPSTQRQYRPQKSAKKRFKADDLIDDNSGASLWAGSGKDNYLFTQNKKKRTGDIILLSVMGKMKNEITLELKRAFPSFKKKKKDSKKEAAPAAPAAPAPPTDEKANEKEVYDRVSSVVAEEINDDHLLIRGQKYLLYKNRKRLVEIQALVSRRDITDDDTVNSDRVLESSIYIVR